MIPRPVAINPALLDGLTTLAGAGAVDSLMRPFFAQHGRSSHGPRQRKGDLRGGTLVVDFDSPKIMGHREAMMNRMKPGDLPTENEPRLGDGEVVTGTDWIDARNVPLSEGRFDLDDYIDYVIGMLQTLGPDTHVMGICQPSVPVLAAIARMEAESDPCAPRSMTLMGGPIDTRRSPTAVNQLAMERGTDWFRRNCIPSCLSRVWAPSGRFIPASCSSRASWR